MSGPDEIIESQEENSHGKVRNGGHRHSAQSIDPKLDKPEFK